MHIIRLITFIKSKEYEAKLFKSPCEHKSHNWLKSLQENIEDAKGLIRSSKSKDRIHNGHKKKDERTINDTRNTTQKTNN